MCMFTCLHISAAQGTIWGSTTGHVGIPVTVVSLTLMSSLSGIGGILATAGTYNVVGSWNSRGSSSIGSSSKAVRDGQTSSSNGRQLRTMSATPRLYAARVLVWPFDTAEPAVVGYALQNVL